MFILIGFTCCNQPHVVSKLNSICTCEWKDTIENKAAKPAYSGIRGALLGTRFKSLEELKTVIQIEYFNSNTSTDSTIPKNAFVRVSHCSNGVQVISVLEAGISQGDFSKARDGGIWNQIGLLFKSPYSLINRRELQSTYILSRWIPAWFGEGDMAFYNIAEESVRNINTGDLAFHNSRDSLEKGYLNSFNHITAQAFLTSCFSEELADFIADAHERYAHPELITGMFNERQMKDMEEGPVDNYVDLINNEWGQELGKQLKQKYDINKKTYWTPELLTNYLNDIQGYYSWAFQIGFKPFKCEDEVVMKFSKKLNEAIEDVSALKRI